MNQAALIGILVSIAIASVGLWWFQLVLPAVRKLPKITRHGVYAAIWLAYFILSMILIKNAS